MTVLAQDNQTNGHVHFAAATTADYTGLTTTTGCNAIVCGVTADIATGDPTISGVTATWDGFSMTPLGNVNASGSVGMAVWMFGLRNPSIGAKHIIVNWTTSAAVWVWAGSFSGVDTTNDSTAFPVAGRVQGNNPTSNLIVPSDTGHLVLSVGDSGTDPTGLLSGTVIYIDTSSGIFINAWAARDTGQFPTRTIGKTSGTAHVQAAVDIAPPAPGQVSLMGAMCL